MGLNRAMLIGRLGADPELRFTQGGSAVLNMRLATTEVYYDRNKERQENTEWHTVVLWGNRAEALNKYLSKGKEIAVEGRIQTRSWEDKDGNKRYATEIVATNVVMLGKRDDAEDGQRNDAPRGPRQEQAAAPADDYDDSIPF